MKPKLGRGALLALMVMGCSTSSSVNQSEQQSRTQPGHADRKNQVDLLFMIDNSPSMVTKQTELRSQLPGFVARINSLNNRPVSYHIGVVTSDLGAGPYTLGNGACYPGGDGGKLQRIGRAADPGCQGPAGNFIEFDQATGANNLPMGQDLQTTLGCMVAAGDRGCGYEQQLESVRLALTAPLTENAGFLRDDALLVAVFVTDEDDCSIDPQSDLFNPSDHSYGVTNSSFRCTQFGLAYGKPPLTPLPDTAGTLSDVSSAKGGKLIDLDRYITLFSTPKAQGGLKTNPNDVLLTSLSGPVINDSITIKVTSPCQNNGNVASCPVLEPSCGSAGSGTLGIDGGISPSPLFAYPGVRLSELMRSSNNSIERSICELPYSTALDAIADEIGRRVN